MLDTDFAITVTAWATVAVAVFTMLLVLATAWYLRQQNQRAATAHSIEVFTRLRERALSSEHVNRRRRVVALLLYLEKHGKTSGSLEYSPDIALYLNDYEWVGRYVQQGVINEQFAKATYGWSLLALYPQLEPYIKKERERPNNNNSWQEVTWFYCRLQKIYPFVLSQESIQRGMRQWVDATTRLTTGERIDVDELVPVPGRVNKLWQHLFAKRAIYSEVRES